MVAADPATRYRARARSSQRPLVPAIVPPSSCMKKTRTQSRAAAVALDNEPRPFTLAGRTALVTGSSRGLGKAIAFALGAAGAKVALNFANGQEQADATFGEFAQRGYEGLLVRADVTNEKHVAKMCHAVSKRLGPIDIVVYKIIFPKCQYYQFQSLTFCLLSYLKCWHYDFYLHDINAM